MNAVEHPVDELPALLHGELSLDAVRPLTVHLRSCASCQRELVEIATGFGVIARAQRKGLTEAEPSALPPLGDLAVDEPADLEHARSRRRRGARWLVPVAAVVVALLVASAAFVLARDDSSSSPPNEAQVELQPVGDRSAEGKVEMSGSGSSRTMVVSTNLPPASRDHYYEVWLLDTRTNGMVPVGVLPTSGTAHFTLPDELLARYDAVDLSLQADNGIPVHSSQSLLRAKYA